MGLIPKNMKTKLLGLLTVVQARSWLTKLLIRLFHYFWQTDNLTRKIICRMKLNSQKRRILPKCFILCGAPPSPPKLTSDKDLSVSALFVS